jgi:tripartite-type tricarboxylate transporter receptor subunit TctC
VVAVLRRARFSRGQQYVVKPGKERAQMSVARSLVILLGFACQCLFAVDLAAAGEKYPSRPVHFVVGFTAGGPNDIVARILSEWLSDHLGQQFVVENRAGSGGMIAANSVINSPPDGYTIMFVAPNNAIGASLYKNLPFVFLRDTVPVAGIMRLTNSWWCLRRCQSVRWQNLSTTPKPVPAS